MGKYDERACFCALNRIFGFKPRIGLAMIRHLGSASAVFELSEKEKDRIAGLHPDYRNRLCESSVEAASIELEKTGSSGFGFLCYTEDGYPQMLKECEDPPIGLYIRSISKAGHIFSGKPLISVVGTRDISPYGMEWCRRIVSALAETEQKPAIISGLALGTDIIAHKTALESGIPTIAVMATGIDSIYPYRHRHTAEEIASKEGCALITDYPPETSPVPVNFIRRNRIIAGLGKASIIIESKNKGGAMITARLASSYNREIYALPGRADDLRSQGCNRLIKEKIAEAVTSEKDLIESLGLCSTKTMVPENPGARLRSIYGRKIGEEQTDKLAAILLAIRKERGISIEELSVKTGTDYSSTAGMVMMLEADGMISTDLLHRCYIRTK